MVAGDRDGVPLRHVRAGVREDVGDDPHRRQRRVDVRVTNHELLEDVVLDRSGELLGLGALLLSGNNVQGKNRQHCAVHRHGHRHAVQRDARKELTHVQDGVHGHACHTDIAGNTRVVRVVAAMGRQVEGDRQALLTGGQVTTVERVGLFSGGESGVLANRPRPEGIHGGVRAMCEWWQTGVGV